MKILLNVKSYYLKNPVSACEPLSKYWAIDFQAEMSAYIHNIFAKLSIKTLKGPSFLGLPPIQYTASIKSIRYGAHHFRRTRFPATKVSV